MSYGNNHIDPRLDHGSTQHIYYPTWQEYKQDQRHIRESETKYDFVHRLSYNKAIGYINRRDRLHIYNGSSYNRKQSEKKAELTEDEQIEADYHAYRYSPGMQSYQYRYRGDRLRGIEILPEKLQRKTTHTLSKRSKDKVRDKMLAMYRACSGKDGFRTHIVNFTLCTLTFIAPVDDNTAMDILNVWFSTIKKRYGNFNYIWVAERQHNGNIHFHIIADQRFPIGYINSLWVKNQIENGVLNKDIINRLKEDHGTTFSNLHTEGKYNIVHDYLNPVDITSVKTINGVSSYLTNYVTKNNSIFDCSAWKSNRKVSKIFTNKIIDKKLFDKTGVANLNKITSRPRNVIIEGRTVYKPPRTYTNETYYGEYCIINTIYNKGRFQYCLNDLEAINKIILNGINEVSGEEIRELISIDREEYQWQFGADMKRIFEIKLNELKAILQIQELAKKQSIRSKNHSHISADLPAWQPVAGWDIS